MNINKTIYHLKFLLVIVFLFFSIFSCTSSSTANFLYNWEGDVLDNATLYGRIIDLDSNKPLVGPVIILHKLGTNKSILYDAKYGCASDLYGNYFIKIPPGFYDIEVSGVGYQRIYLNNVELLTSRKYLVDFQLKLDFFYH